MGTGQPVGARGHRRRDDHMRRPAYRCKSMWARGCRREARGRVCWVLVAPLLWESLLRYPRALHNHARALVQVHA